MRRLPPTTPLAVAAMLLAAIGAVAPAARAQQPIWAPIPSSAILPPLIGRIVYDRARQRLVAFDASTTAECDRAGWTTVGPGIGLNFGAAAYDSQRRVTVSFGGLNFFSADNTTREWNGNSWTIRTFASIPPGRVRAAMAYDPLRARIVLFGGQDAALQHTGDTLEYDGTTWALVPVPAAPPPRSLHAMTFDPVRGVTLLYGGSANGSPGFGDTWEYNGATWTQHSGGPPPGNPGPLAYDEARARAVLVMANSASNAVTWERAGTIWSLAEAAGPMQVPLTGSDFDPILGRVVAVASDRVGVGHSRLWGWNGTTWEPVTAVEMAPAVEGMAIAFCPATNSTLLFGGVMTFGLGFDQSYEWRGGVWRRLALANNPPALGDSAMAADVTGGVLLFGGRAGLTASGSTFRFTGTDWQQLAPANAPPPRSQHGMASDTARGRVVLFGGMTGAGTPLGDTWEWDGVNWTGLLPALSPPPRANPALAFDGGASRTLLFGGGTQNGPVTDDFWQWDGVNWQQNATAFRPTPRGQGQLAWDPRRNRTVLAAGFAYHPLGTPPATGTFEWDGTAWTAIAGTQPTVSLSSRGGFDPVAARYVLHTTDVFAAGSTWEFGPASVAAGVTTGAACAGSAGAPHITTQGLPRLGNPFFAVRLSSVLPSALAALGLAQQPAAIALGGGCTLLLSAPTLLLAVAGAAGAVDFALPLPAVPALHGATVHCQGAAIDPQGPWLGLASFSSGLQLTLD